MQIFIPSYFRSGSIFNLNHEWNREALCSLDRLYKITVIWLEAIISSVVHANLYPPVQEFHAAFPWTFTFCLYPLHGIYYIIMVASGQQFPSQQFATLTGSSQAVAESERETGREFPFVYAMHKLPEFTKPGLRVYLWNPFHYLRHTSPG